jgi:hypothetical protein
MKCTQISPKFWQFAVSIAVVSAGLGASAVQAAATEVLLRSGQTIPGDPKSKPLTVINDFGIDSQQNVVVTLQTQTFNEPFVTNATYPNAVTFKGIYRLPPGQGPQLVDSARTNVISGTSTGIDVSADFLTPSISLGQVAFVRSGRQSKAPLFNEFKFGTPGAVRLLAKSGLPDQIYEKSLATVNGKVFTLGLPQFSGSPVLAGITKYENGQAQLVVKADDPVITAGGKPALSIADSSFLLRASSTNLVFARSVGQTIQVFEKPDGGKLRKAYEASGSLCGLAASRSNIVLCVSNTILARRGNTSQFTQIKSPLPIALQPSISNETVVFIGQTFDVRGQKRRQTLYLDKLGQPQRELIQTAETFAETIDLSSTGQSINGSAVVYRYTKRDGSFELRRITLK